MSPAIAAISLGLVGYAASGERFGRNARFASIGNGLAAAGMGAVGYFWSTQAVFLVTAAFIVPTLIANAFLTGVFSEVDSRYQARIVWLLPLLAGITLYRWKDARAIAA